MPRLELCGSNAENRLRRKHQTERIRRVFRACEPCFTILSEVRAKARQPAPRSAAEGTATLKKNPALARRVTHAIRRLSGLQIGGRGLAVLAIGFDVEVQLLALSEAAHSRAVDGGDVNEHVGSAIVLLDEAKTLLRVEELYGTCSHFDLLNAPRRLRTAQPFVRARSGFGVFLEKSP